MVGWWFGLKNTGMIFFGLTSKPVTMIFSGLTSKPVAMVSWLSLKTKVVQGFLVWTSKPAAMVW
jgi:hypothetical protein